MDNSINQIRSSFNYAVHSNYLIHWTGKDIDKHDISTDDNGQEKYWFDNSSSKTRDFITDKYVERLLSILKYGFWMTEDIFSYRDLEKSPKNPQTCFTELRLSQARIHAQKFGRLGIGVKRPFVFKHRGRPVVYYYEGKNDPLLETCKEKLKNDPMLNFFKPMKDFDGINHNIYNLYDESEWRIIKTDSLLREKLVIDPKVGASEYYKKLNDEEKQKLKYLIPIKSWLAMIIYPSLEVKRAVSENKEIQKLIKDIVGSNETCDNEKNIWPIEMAIDACRNF